jgi:hypothetical protein
VAAAAAVYQLRLHSVSDDVAGCRTASQRCLTNRVDRQYGLGAGVTGLGWTEPTWVSTMVLSLCVMMGVGPGDEACTVRSADCRLFTGAGAG